MKKVECKLCGRLMEVDDKAKGGVCWHCIAINTPTPDDLKKIKEEEIKIAKPNRIKIKRKPKLKIAQFK